MFDFGIDWEGINRRHDERRGEFQRLCCDPSCQTPEVGDTVIVAAGLIGRGFDWVREEAEVIALGETSVKVRWRRESRYEELNETWIHPALITDVIRRQKVAESGAVDTPISEPQSDA
jgi:preprotein translocase subunit YajC